MCQLICRGILRRDVLSGDVLLRGVLHNGCFLGFLRFWSLINRGPQTFRDTFWTFHPSKVFPLSGIIFLALYILQPSVTVVMLSYRSLSPMVLAVCLTVNFGGRPFFQ